jgi:hypothetical protein
MLVIVVLIIERRDKSSRTAFLPYPRKLMKIAHERSE